MSTALVRQYLHRPVHAGRPAAVAVATLLLAAVPAAAVQITNHGSANVTASDLTLYSDVDGLRNPQVVMVSGDATDDVVIAPGASISRNLDHAGNPVAAYRSYTFSYTDARGEHEVFRRGSGALTLAALFTPQSNDVLFIGLLGDLLVPENQVYQIVGGLSPQLPDVYFSTTPFQIDGSGRRVGDTPFSGQVLSGPTVAIGVAEPALPGLLALAGLLLAWQRRSAGRGRTGQATAA